MGFFCLCYRKPKRREWQKLDGKWPELSHAVGATDGLSHRIGIPENEPAELYYKLFGKEISPINHEIQEAKTTL